MAKRIILQLLKRVFGLFSLVDSELPLRKVQLQKRLAKRFGVRSFLDLPVRMRACQVHECFANHNIHVINACSGAHNHVSCELAANGSCLGAESTKRGNKCTSHTFSLVFIISALHCSLVE